MTASQPVRRVFRAAGIITVALMLSRVLGYVREALLASRFGASHTTDAYLVAQDLPASLFAAISTALVMVFIPVYRSVVQERGEDAGWRFVNTVSNVVFVLALALVAIGWAAAPWLVPSLVPGLPEEALTLAVGLTRTMLPMMVFMAVSGVASALLNANHQFTLPALVGLSSNVVVIAALWMVGRPEQVYWVAWAVVAGAAAGALVQLPGIPSLGYRYHLRLDLRDPGFVQTLRLVGPVIITAITVQLQNFADRFLASGLAEGSISALNYAVRVNGLPYGVVGIAIATALYPSLAEDAAADRREKLANTVSRGLRTLAFVLLPMAAGLAVFAEPVVTAIFQRGAFDPAATAATAYALRFYALGILFFGWLDFLNRAFFALKDSLTPMWIGVAMVVMNIGLNVALVGPLAHGGLALGTSASTCIAVGVLLWRLTQKLPEFRLVEAIRPLVLSVGTAAAGALAGVLVYRTVAGWAPGLSLAHQAVRLTAGLGTIVVVHAGLGLAVGLQDGAALTMGLVRRLARRRGV